jgi:hypothetical protein
LPDELWNLHFTRPAYLSFFLWLPPYLRWLPVLLLGWVLNATAEDVEVRLQLVPTAAETSAPATHTEVYNLLALRDSVSANTEESVWQARIFALLQKHHQAASEDPVFLREDMAQMAHYFSRYTEVRTLFDDLAGADWQWQYARGGAETRVTGSQLKVDSALVLFDSRAGAQFRFQRACEQMVPYCYTAPADVLLHELLHVRGILRDTRTFIDHGGLSEHLYPHAHEQHTITLERNLYTRMAAQDRIPRPRRSDHTGRRTSASCVTCLR